MTSNLHQKITNLRPLTKIKIRWLKSPKHLPSTTVLELKILSKIFFNIKSSGEEEEFDQDGIPDDDPLLQEHRSLVSKASKLRSKTDLLKSSNDNSSLLKRSNENSMMSKEGIDKLNQKDIYKNYKGKSEDVIDEENTGQQAKKLKDITAGANVKKTSFVEDAEDDEDLDKSNNSKQKREKTIVLKFVKTDISKELGHWFRLQIRDRSVTKKIVYGDVYELSFEHDEKLDEEVTIFCNTKPKEYEFVAKFFSQDPSKVQSNQVLIGKSFSCKNF